MVRGGLLVSRWTVMTRQQKPCSNTTAVIGTVVVGVFPMSRMRLSTTTKLKKIDFLQQWSEQERFKRLPTASSKTGSVKIKNHKTFCLTMSIYPHSIFYDFELYEHKTQKVEVTASLTYKDAHIPISVSIGDTGPH